MMRSLLTALLFLVIPVLALGWLSSAWDKPETLIEAVPTTGCPKPANPCDRINCYRVNTRAYT